MNYYKGINKYEKIITHTYNHHSFNKPIILMVHYINDLKEGIQQEYYDDDKLYAKVEYKNNYKEGKQEWYDKNGKVIKTMVFKMDRPINLMKKVQVIKENKVLKELQGLNFSPNRPQD